MKRAKWVSVNPFADIIYTEKKHMLSTHCIFLSVFLVLLSSLGHCWSILSSHSSIKSESKPSCPTRRLFLPTFTSLLFPQPTHAQSATSQPPFRTTAFGKQEYTNSIIVSRDTNISPSEVYDSIASSFLQNPLVQARTTPRAWDVGCGAGVSTQVLWNMGYQDIVAIDWSSTAWDTFVQSCPPSVVFYPQDDERYYYTTWSQNPILFDAIVFNFAINESKAKMYARKMLSQTGRLLAPVNIQSDYWLKQAYRVYDAEATVLWDATDVGAWSVLFQPDVTQDTCQGIWCSPYNGFKKR